MEKPVSSVVKRNDVRLTEEPGAGAPASREPDRPYARIVSQAETEALIEVVCECGRKVRLRCTYARPAGGV